MPLFLGGSEKGYGFFHIFAVCLRDNNHVDTAGRLLARPTYLHRYLQRRGARNFKRSFGKRLLTRQTLAIGVTVRKVYQTRLRNTTPSVLTVQRTDMITPLMFQRGFHRLGTKGLLCRRGIRRTIIQRHLKYTIMTTTMVLSINN